MGCHIGSGAPRLYDQQMASAVMSSERNDCVAHTEQLVYSGLQLAQFTVPFDAPAAADVLHPIT